MAKETPQMRDNRRDTAKKRAEKAKKKRPFSAHGRPRVGYDPTYAVAYDRIFGKAGRRSHA